MSLRPPPFAWLIPVGMAAVVNLTILGNYFVDDDSFNLYNIVNAPRWQFLLEMHGGHLLMTRNAVFALSFHAFGTDPRPWFALVLATHLLNVGLLYRTARLLTGSWRLACVVAGAWGTAPINLGTLGWYSVHGQVLAITAGLWVLSRLAAGRAGAPARPAAPWGWGLAMLVGGTCFGTGIGLALVMPAIAWLLLPPGPRRRRALLALAGAAAAVPVLYLAALKVNAAVVAGQADDGGMRPIWVTQLILANALHLGDHLHLLVALAQHGVAGAVLGPLAGQVHPTWALGVVLALGLTVRARARRPVWRALLACLLFGAGSYAVIAAGRSAFAGEQVAGYAAAGRFHYAGTLAVDLMVGVALASLSGTGGRAAGWRTGALLAWSAGATLAVVALRPPIDHHHRARAETAQMLANLRGQIAAAPRGATVHIPVRRFRSVGALVADSPDFPGNAALFAIFFPDDVITGRRVTFLTDDPAVDAIARRGRRSARLVRYRRPPPAQAAP